MTLLIVLVVGAALSHMVPFPFLIEAFRPSQSLWHVDNPRGTPPTFYLTFDDGPNADWTPPLLDELKRQDARATFFLIDDHITPETEAIVRRIADEGHAIGLHSGTRKLMVASPSSLAERLTRAAARIRAITNREPCRLFRPHAGWRSLKMYAGLQKAGYRLAGWSWGMWDWHWWQKPRGERVAARLAKKASPGDIVVIHDGHHKDPPRGPATRRRNRPVARARPARSRVLVRHVVRVVLPRASRFVVRDWATRSPSG